MNAPSTGIARRIGGVVALIAILLVAYISVIRPGQCRWGATDAEVARAMPGDELVADPSLDATRAITIRGTPDQIWPWLVQMGFQKAGYYGYDLVENIGSARGIRSADTIIPELQSLHVGDRVEISAVAWVHVRAIEPNRFIVWGSDDRPATGSFLWALEPVDSAHTRLISRVRLHYVTEFPLILLQGFTELFDHVAIRRILHGVRARVEGDDDRLRSQILDMTPWALSFGAMIVAMVLMFRRRRWAAAWVAALAFGGALLFTLYSDADPSTELAVLFVLVPLLVGAWRSDAPSGSPRVGTPSAWLAHR